MAHHGDYEREKHLALLNRIVKMLNLAEGEKAIGNQAAAENIAAMAADLMRKHKLEMSDLEIGKQEVEDPINGEVYDPYYVKGLKPRGIKMEWQVILADAVAFANFCQVATYTRSNRILFMGRKSDRTVAMYMFSVLGAAAERLVKQAYRKYKREVGGAGELTKGFNSSWLLGFARGVAEKIHAEHDAFINVARKTGVAIIRLTDARTAVAKYVEQQRFSAGRPGRAPRRNLHGDAYDRGKTTGRSTNLPARGVQSSGAGAKQIGGGS